MLKRELLEYLTVSQYGAYRRQVRDGNVKVQTFALPDGRAVEWHDERALHEFLQQLEAAGQETLNPNHGEVSDLITETMPVHACFGPANHANQCLRPGSEDTGAKP
jgi:hypothetical protein